MVNSRDEISYHQEPKHVPKDCAFESVTFISIEIRTKKLLRVVPCNDFVIQCISQRPSLKEFACINTNCKLRFFFHVTNDILFALTNCRMPKGKKVYCKLAY